MRRSNQIAEKLDAEAARDPREGQGAEVIDLATRNVLPQVARRSTRADGLGLAAGITIVGLLGAFTLWNLDAARQADQAQTGQGPQAAVNGVGPNGAVPPQAVTTIPPQPAPVPLPNRQVMPPEGQVAPGAAPGSVQPMLMPQAGQNANPYSSPTVVYDAGAASITAPPTRATMPGETPVAPAPGGDDFAARVGGVGGGSASATSSFDPRTTVAQGTLIPAVLETAINTDVPGYVRAIVSSDVRSFDGTRVLVPRSSRLIGQYKSGLQAGQKRAYVIWTRLIRPDGVSVNIASPATTFGGETGLDGKVNNHFFAKFGSAMLLSVIDGLTAVASGGSSVIIGGGQSAAAAAIGQGNNIGPTITVRQGQPIRVFTARDLNFAGVAAR